MRAIVALTALAIAGGAASAPLVIHAGGEAAVAPRLLEAAPDDTAALARLLDAARGAETLFCEFLVRSADQQGWWSSSGTRPGGALEVDSASNALIQWIHTDHEDPRFVPRLAAAMRENDHCVRRVAGSMLGHIELPAAGAALLAALDDANAGTRSVAAIGLGHSENSGALPRLIARLRDSSPAVRKSAAWALGAIEDKTAMLPLIDLLRDPDAGVRQTAAWAIGQVTN